MSNSAPAIWSAVAATFAALSSLLIMLIQRRNLLESVRPELVLTGWNRNAKGTGDPADDVISFGTIRNVGRGVALNVILNCFQKTGNRPTAVLSTKRVAILAANETEELNAEIMVWWENVARGTAGAKFLPINVDILCWDCRGMRHQTRYNLLAVQLGSNCHVTNPIAPGVMLVSRTTASRPRWLLKLLAKARSFGRSGVVAGLLREPEAAAASLTNGTRSRRPGDPCR